jgi:hypothetical protein
MGFDEEKRGETGVLSKEIRDNQIMIVPNFSGARLKDGPIEARHSTPRWENPYQQDKR